MYFYIFVRQSMFGYIRTDTPELRVLENEYYKAAYCGLCRAQGKCTGQCSRMTLNYDIVFLALLRLAVSGEKPEIRRGRCIAHPFKKRAYIANCEALSYCAYVSALLIYGKTVDDISDEQGFKRFRAALMKPFASNMRKRSLRKYAALDQKITDGLKLLAETERLKLNSVDVPADCFGNILGDILSFDLDGEDEIVMRNIGRHIGRWIYIVDACDDLGDDIKKDRFNPFIYLYGKSELTEEQKRNIADSLKLELLASEPAFDLLNFNENTTIEGIIRNIIYRGMPDVAERVLELDGKSKFVNKRKNSRGN